MRIELLDGDRERDEKMKPHALMGTGIILFALAFIAIDTEELRGQKNSSVVYDQPPSLPQQKSGETGGVGPAPAKPSAAGKSSLLNQQALFSKQSLRSAKPGYDPTRNAPLSPKTAGQRRTSPTDGVTTANVQTNATNSGKVSLVTPAGYQKDGNRSLNRDGVEVPPIANLTEPPSVSVSPNMRLTPPGVRGSILGLQGESILELSIRLKQDIQVLEQQNDELRRSNSSLQSRYDESQHHLLSVVREIQSARKDLEVARNDLDRLRNELTTLQDKIRAAQKEHTELLQSMGPLLQQMLESDEISSLPTSPME